MDKCIFDEAEKFCSALTEKKCEGCTFRKTIYEYTAAQEAASAMLDSKNLQPFPTRDNSGRLIMSTQKITRW